MGIEFIRQTQLVVCRRPFCGSAECLVDCLQRYFRIIIFSFLRCLLANTVTPIFHLPAGWSGREWLCTLLCRTRIEVVIYCSENYCSRDAKANRNHNRALPELLLFAAGDVEVGRWRVVGNCFANGASLRGTFLFLPHSRYSNNQMRRIDRSNLELVWPRLNHNYYPPHSATYYLPECNPRTCFMLLTSLFVLLRRCLFVVSQYSLLLTQSTGIRVPCPLHSPYFISTWSDWPYIATYTVVWAR